MGKYLEFERELTTLINKHSIENQSNTPDFILARFMVSILENFEIASNSRQNWYQKGIKK